MNQRRMSSGSFAITGLIISALGAVFFLFSDTLFGDSDLAHNLMFLGMVMLPMGVILSLIGVLELLFSKIKRWIKKQ